MTKLQQISLWCRDTAEHILEAIAELKGEFIALAERELGTILPGYTHLQHNLCYLVIGVWPMLITET